MEVVYTLTEDDYLAFCRHVYRKRNVSRTGLQTALSIAWIILGCLCLILSLLHGSDFLLSASALVLLLLSIPSLAPVLLTLWTRARLRRLRNRGVTGPMRLMLTDTSLVTITKTERAEVRWCDMVGIEVIDSHTFIYFTAHAVWIFPRAGFASDDEYFRTRDYALARVGEKQMESPLSG